MRRAVAVVVWLAIVAGLAGKPRKLTLTPYSRNFAPKITVHLFDYAAVSSTLLASAEREAARILAGANLEVTFIDCPKTPVDDRTCTTSDLNVIRVQLLGQSASHRDTEPNSFGFAVRKTERGPYAVVFCDRVIDFATTRHMRTSALLGAVAAHEIGHLLLGSGAHSKSGIMASRWTRRELEQINHGRLAFSSSERYRISTLALSRGAH